MTNNKNLSGVELASILTEEIYRRHDEDNPINVFGDLGIRSSDIEPYINLELTGLNKNSTSLLSDPLNDNIDDYYYSDRGFVGRVVEKNGTVYVVFRGTDEASSFANGFSKMLVNPDLIDPENYISDLGDWHTNLHLGKGTIKTTQLDDALELTRAAKAYAASRGFTVEVAGQSLGGGLAGLVSAIENVKGYAIAPAPFQNQLSVYASIEALKIHGMTNIQDWIYSYFSNPLNPGEMLTINDAFRIGGYDLWDAITANLSRIPIEIRDTLTNVKIQEILNDRDNILNQLLSNLDSKLEKHTITGEILGDGLANVAEFLGAVRFNTDPDKTIKYDLGEPATWLSLDVAVSLHGSALHALVIRTDKDINYTTGDEKQQFSELLKNNKHLREALLDKVIISAPIGGDRQDPHGEGFGGSGIRTSTSGPDAGILFRTLWKSVGIEDGFYDKFYTAIDKHLTLSYNYTENLQKGLLFLGLQSIRDGLQNENNKFIENDERNPFGLKGLHNGVGVNIDTIKHEKNIEVKNEFNLGLSEIKLGIKSFIDERMSTHWLNTSNMKKNFSVTDFNDFKTFVYTSSLIRYDEDFNIVNEPPRNLFYIRDDSVQNSKHIIIGNSKNDFIVGSDAGDIIISDKYTNVEHVNNYIVGGAGDDYIMAGSGVNTIFGGSGNDYIVAGVDLNNKTQTVYGGDGDDTIFAGGSGYYYGGKGDDIFITGNASLPYGGIFDGGHDYDIAYVNDINNLYIAADVDGVKGTVIGIKDHGFFKDIEEFRVGWNFNQQTNNWEQGSGSTYTKNEIYNKIYLKSDIYFSSVDYAVLNASAFSQGGSILLFKGTMAKEYKITTLYAGLVSIDDTLYEVRHSGNSANISFYLDLPAPINFTHDTHFTITFGMGVRDESWDGFIHRGGGVISTSLAENSKPIPPIKDFYTENAIIPVNNNTFRGVVFKTQEEPNTSQSIDWKITNSFGNKDFYILPNGELHSLKPFIGGIKLEVQAFDGTTTVTKIYQVGDGNNLNLIEGTSGDDIIYDTKGKNKIEAGAGNDIIFVENSKNSDVYAGEGNDIFIIKTNGNFYGETGNNIFDLSEMPNINSVNGQIDGGDGTNTIYLSSLSDIIFRNDYSIIVNGFLTNKIDQYKIGWNFNASNMTWTETANSLTLSLDEVINKGIYGHINGINDNWSNVIAPIVEESSPLISEYLTIFSGELKSEFSNLSINNVSVKIGGKNYVANVVKTGDVISISVLNSELYDAIYRDMFYTGTLSFAGNKEITFGGYIKEKYSTWYSNEILGDGSIKLEGTNTLIDYQFNQNTNNNTIIKWYLTGDDKENFTISEDGKLSSNGNLDFSNRSTPFNLTVNITDGYSIISKNVTVGIIVDESNEINNDWESVLVENVNESLENNIENIIIFQGMLKVPLTTSSILSATVSFNGINWLAEVTENNGIYTITLPKIAIANVTQDTTFNGKISVFENNVHVPKATFVGLIKDIYDLENGLTEIVGDTIIEASATDTLDGYQFNVDNFNHDKPVIWSIIGGSNSQNFSISSTGVLSSINPLDFASVNSIEIQATDGIKTVVKTIYINPYNPINVIYGTSGNDIIYGTAKDDIIYGLDGDDIIYAKDGFDTIYGGAGNDTLIATNFYADLYGEDGDDILIGSDRGDYLYGGNGNDILYGGGHKDRMWGGDGADIFVYKNVTDSDYYNTDLSDFIGDLEDEDSFDFTEMGQVSFDWNNGPAGSLYVEVNWNENDQYGYLAVDVDRDGTFDMAIDFDPGAAGLTQINFVDGPTYYLNNVSPMQSAANDNNFDDDMTVSPVTDNNIDEQHYYWPAV